MLCVFCFVVLGLEAVGVGESREGEALGGGLEDLRSSNLCAQRGVPRGQPQDTAKKQTKRNANSGDFRCQHDPEALVLLMLLVLFCLFFLALPAVL